MIRFYKKIILFWICISVTFSFLISALLYSGNTNLFHSILTFIVLFLLLISPILILFAGIYLFYQTKKSFKKYNSDLKENSMPVWFFPMSFYYADSQLSGLKLWFILMMWLAYLFTILCLTIVYWGLGYILMNELSL